MSGFIFQSFLWEGEEKILRFKVVECFEEMNINCFFLIAVINKWLYNNYRVLTLHKNSIDTFSPKGVWEKSKGKMWKNLSCRRDSNPGPLALATSALTTELRQPSVCKTLTFFPFFLNKFSGIKCIIVSAL